MNENSFYTKGEEITNAVTHGIGTLLATAALVLLVVYAVQFGSIWHVISYSIFGATLFILYLGSTLYHSLTHKGAKKIFRIIDHSSIFLLIAGTYTPYTLTVLRSPLGWAIFGVIWSMAAAGIVIKALWVDRFDKLSTVLYVLMGWMIVISINKLWILLPNISFSLLVLGGVTYTLGAILYSFDRIPYNHPIWHVFVMGGSTFHFFSVIYMLK